MNDSDPSSPAASPVKPASEADGEERPGDSWLDRIRAAVGLKGPGSIRTDLAAALAAGDVTAGFTPGERAMLANILKLREVRVDDIMVPRADIDAVDIDTPLTELLVTFRKSGHSRMPVFRDTLDDPIGMVHIKDLMGYVTAEASRAAGGGKDGASGSLALDHVELSGTLAGANLVRNILFVPPSMPVAALLANMQASRMQIALVIDEYGGTDGLVSMEDAVEVIVGDIEDEYDEEAGPTIVPDASGGFLADARADLDELAAAIGTDLAAGEHGEDVDTIGGLVFSLVGRIPVRGELVSAPGGYEFEILDADPRRIKRVRIYRRPAAAEPRRRPRPSGA
jgi:hemolysin (HlyC) family protein